MISGGLAGGSTQSEVDWAFLAEIGFAIADTIVAMLMICNAVTAIMSGAVFIGGVGVILGLVCIYFATCVQIQTLELMCAYIDGDDEAGKQIINNMWTTVAITIGTTALAAIAGPAIKQVLKNKLFREYGQNLIEKLQKSWGEIIPVGKKIQSLKNMYVGSGAIQTAGEKFGAGGLDWILGKKHLEIPGGIWNKLVKADGLLNYSDDLLKAIKNSKGYADDIIEIVEKYGDDAADAVVKYGDDVVPIIKQYGDDAIEVIKKYGDDAVESMKGGMSPGQVKAVNYKPVVLDSKIKLTVADESMLDEITEKVGKLRGKLPSAIKNSGNFAYADVSINGNNSIYYASSAIDSLDDYAFLAERVPDISVQPEHVYYEAIEAVGKNGDIYLRDSCTEYKIINNIAKVVNSDARGKIVLFTELEPCDSCKNIFNIFSSEHPNIEIELIHNNGNRIKAIRE